MRIHLILSAAVFILFAPTAAAQHQSHTPAPTQSSAPAATAAEAEAPPPQPTEPLPPSETPATNSVTEPMLTPMPSDMSAMDHQMSGMQGVLGPYPMSREASGTSWQPDTSEHMGQMFERGEWMLMGHVMLNGVYDWQDGPRGDEKAFVSGMLMGSARRDVGANGRLNLRVMLSPDPFMGRDGYPLLLASGETADGVTPLVDRQHPHELFMELSGSYSYRLSARDSAFVYLGYPGEPAFGPPAFMHRLSALDSPEAPITHHWFDSTHITFGVLTAGYTRGDWRIEASQFTGVNLTRTATTSMNRNSTRHQCASAGIRLNG